MPQRGLHEHAVACALAVEPLAEQIVFFAILRCTILISVGGKIHDHHRVGRDPATLLVNDVRTDLVDVLDVQRHDGKIQHSVSSLLG
jgi:hypothetical protein